jgi:hypothetical protein
MLQQLLGTQYDLEVDSRLQRYAPGEHVRVALWVFTASEVVNDDLFSASRGVGANFGDFPQFC